MVDLPALKLHGYSYNPISWFIKDFDISNRIVDRIEYAVLRRFAPRKLDLPSGGLAKVHDD